MHIKGNSPAMRSMRERNLRYACAHNRANEALRASSDRAESRGGVGRSDTVATPAISGLKVSRDGRALLAPLATSVVCVVCGYVWCVVCGVCFLHTRLHTVSGFRMGYHHVVYDCHGRAQDPRAVNTCNW